MEERPMATTLHGQIQYLLCREELEYGSTKEGILDECTEIFESEQAYDKHNNYRCEDSRFTGSEIISTM